MRRKTWIQMVSLLALGVAGCSTTGPFGREKLVLPIGPSYVGGRGMQLFPTSPSLIANIKDAMSDVGVHSITQSADPSGVVILEGRAADDRKTRVTIQTSGSNATVSVKVGRFGDEPVTRSMLDRIGSRQGNLSPPPEPAELPDQPPRPPSLFSREAVPDSIMLRDQFDPSSRPN